METEIIESMLSDGTKAAIANIVDYTIKKEYGNDVSAGIGGATVLAKAGLDFDLRLYYITRADSDTHFAGYVNTTLRILVRNGLAARLCQCHKINDICSHGIDARCLNHFESDVPPVSGVMLCGRCYIASST